MDKKTLLEVNEWAQNRIDSGEEPPWTLQKLKLLANLSGEFADGFESTKTFCPGLRTALKKRVENVVALQVLTKVEDDPFVNMPA